MTTGQEKKKKQTRRPFHVIGSNIVKNEHPKQPRARRTENMSPVCFCLMNAVGRRGVTGFTETTLNLDLFDENSFLILTSGLKGYKCSRNGRKF